MLYVMTDSKDDLTWITYDRSIFKKQKTPLVFITAITNNTVEKLMEMSKKRRKRF